MDHGIGICAQMMSELVSQKKQGVRFSVSFDEWTSNRSRRYMNISVHESSERFWNLGLSSMPASKCVELLKKKLQANSLSLEDDIVCIVTDGASVMKKLGKLILPEQQLCYAHGVQLAVLDVLYKGSLLQSDASCGHDDETEAGAEQIVNEDDNDDELADIDESLQLDMTCETEEVDEC